MPKEIKTNISNPKGKFKPGSEARQYVVGSPRGGQGRGGEVETNIHLCQNHCHYNFVLTSSLWLLSSLLSSLSLAGSPSWWLAHLFSSRFSSSTQSLLETMRRAQQPEKCRLPTNLLGEGSKVCIWPFGHHHSLSASSPLIALTTCIPRSSESRIGEYFSGSLAAVDLDGDGLDELLVGSPLASVKQARTNHFCTETFNGNIHCQVNFFLAFRQQLQCLLSSGSCKKGWR